MNYYFDSAFTVGQPLYVQSGYTVPMLKDEPMFFGADLDFAWKHGGDITRCFLETLGGVSRATIFDSRVHMLMRGWYPAIPGWHHDDVDRGPDGQPVYPPTVRPQHVMGLIGDNVSKTLFASGRASFPAPPAGHGVYEYWHDEVEAKIASGELTIAEAPMGALTFFDWQSWHRGVKATSSGWRWFGRASWSTSRKPINEIRRQVQVYLSADTKGW